MLVSPTVNSTPSLKEKIFENLRVCYIEKNRYFKSFIIQKINSD